MIAMLTAVHVLIALVMILIVLLQSAQGTDVGSAFGGMGSQATFGPRGTATFLSKATVALAAVFMVTSITLTILGRESSTGNESVLSGQETAPAAATPAPPQTPATPAATPAGTPAGEVGVAGLPGVHATVTVENPGEKPGQAAPAATVTPGPAAPAPGAPPSAPAAAPKSQPPK
jgi:preprotein translocase subunit SecG